MKVNKPMNSTLNPKHMAGKICLVTGATSGIGKVTATALAAQGAKVIITGRNPQKTEQTARQIKSDTGNEAVQYLLADFSDLRQVRTVFAAGCAGQQCRRILQYPPGNTLWR
jgi:NAD(P)-dependent dehydrogenase (short-subunit alcohol dehydrogenase family)